MSKDTIIVTSKKLGLRLKNSSNIMSRYDYNKYIFEYDSMFSKTPLEIIVETSYYQSAYPAVKHNISCFVGKFCKEKSITLPIQFEGANVIMNVQTLRTFVDKVFAVCDYVLLKKIERNSRHLYDIYKLLNQIEINDELKILVANVRKDRIGSKNNPSANTRYNIPELIKYIIKSKCFENDYKSVTQKLLYEDISYDTIIDDGLAKILEYDIFTV